MVFKSLGEAPLPMAAATGAATVTAMSESLTRAAPVEDLPRSDTSPGNQHGSGPPCWGESRLSAKPPPKSAAIAPA
jgi:hypothetical protein